MTKSRLTSFAAALAAVLGAFAGGGASAAPGQGRAPETATLPAAAASTAAVAEAGRSSSMPRDDGQRGRWLLRRGPSGPLLVWRSPARVPITDSRPEFRVGLRSLGYPHVSPDDRGLSMPLAALRGSDPADVEAWVGLRRLDSHSRALGSAQDLTPTPTTSATTIAGPDPGLPGPFAVESFDYSAAPLSWPGFAAPMEVLGHAVLPVGVQPAPLILFLHGRHYWCYGHGDTGFWPCTGESQPVPSYLGYEYLQRLLASQGYATVSLSANALNSQDGITLDGGARARAALVLHHLRLLARWSADGSNARWSGRLDMHRVVLIGHSRGGEGVNQASIDAGRSDPFDIVGQVLIAPTDFGYQTAPYTPTEVILGYCDGDVSDLHGQRYVDAALTQAADDRALRSTVLLMGANHNFFNTEWTPGISAAPSADDWWDQDDPLCGRDVSPTRLTASEQRRAAETWVAAGVHAFLGDDRTIALRYLDARRPIALADAGPAIAWTAALGGRRVTVRLRNGAAPAGDAAACRAGTPLGDPIAGKSATPPLCGGDTYYRQIHWTPSARVPASVHSAFAVGGLPADLEFAWASAGAEGGFALSTPLDLSASNSRLDLRTIVDPEAGPVRVQVVLGSGADHWAGPVRTLDPMPGGTMLAALWGQTLAVDPSSFVGHIDLARIDAISLRAVSDGGRVWLLDASVRRPGMAPEAGSQLPRVRLGRLVQPEGDARPGIALLPFRVLGEVTSPGRFSVSVQQDTFGYRREPEYRSVTVQPGQTSGVVPIRYEADNLDDLPRQRQLVFAATKRGLVTSGFTGKVTVLDDDPAPKATFTAARTAADYGDTLVYFLRLSKPLDYYPLTRLGAVRVHRLRPLRTSDVPMSWIRQQMGDVPDDVPLARVWHDGFLQIAPGQTSVRFEVPTLSHPPHLWPKALTVRFSARMLTPPLRATVRVRLDHTPSPND
jgi:hypothetical protein